MTSTIHTLFETAVTCSGYVASSIWSFRRQAAIPRRPMAHKISDRVFSWCTSRDSISEALSKDPTLAPGKVAEKLYGKEGISVTEKKAPKHRESATQEDLERAYQCGKFGPTKPSELFLRIFHDALCSLEHDPMMGVVSPPLMGSCGAIPLTIIAPLPDICRHMVWLFECQNCIVMLMRVVEFNSTCGSGSISCDQLLDDFRCVNFDHGCDEGAFETSR